MTVDNASELQADGSVGIAADAVGSAQVFVLDNSDETKTTAALARFNERWRRHLEYFRTFGSPPPWTRDAVIDAAMRQEYERYLPVQEFRRDLALVALRILPAPSWLPSVLRLPEFGNVGRTATRIPDSLPDLWATLPDALAGRVQFELGELLSLLCALADPMRFGAGLSRYPEQHGQLRDWLSRGTARQLMVLDLGCGVGLGTYEALALARQMGADDAWALGLTLEPLEAWMAANRQAPHDPRCTALLEQFAAERHAQFIAGDIRDVPLSGAADIVLCNGVVGGEALHEPRQVERFLHELGRVLRPGGIAALANRFHDGRLQHLRAVMRCGERQGWMVTGGPSSLLLTRPEVPALRSPRWRGGPTCTPCGDADRNAQV